MKNGVVAGFVLLTALLLPVAAKAETLTVEVRRPAVADEAYMLRSLAIGRFTGTDGRALSFAIERALAGARDLDGSAVFDMFEAGRGEGSVTGRADVDIEETRYLEKRKFCPGTRDKNAKCDDAVKEEVEITCRKRVTVLSADVRIAKSSDGRIVFSRNLPNRIEHRSCAGDAPMPESAVIVDTMISSAAQSVTGDFVPYAAREDIRIREDRKGLSKPDAEAFKLAVRTTKTSGAEACRQFAMLAERAPDQKSIIFNMALCAEAAGDFEAAIDGYRHLGNAMDAASSIQRAQSTLMGMRQQAAREGRRP